MIDRLEMAARLEANKGPVQQFVIANSLRMLAEAGVVDPGWPAELKAATDLSPKTLTFSDEAKAALKEEVGYSLIYPLKGKSIAGMKEAGRPFWYVVDAGPQFLALPSQLTEVAINPDPKKFFLPKSNNKTLPEQQEMIARYSEELRRKTGMKDIEADMGEAPDYVELAFAHLDATGYRLFGERYGYGYARTKTPTVGSRVALVGYFVADNGLNVNDWRRDNGDDFVWAVPLVKPIETR